MERLITQKKDSKLQEERFNWQRAYKSTGIGRKKEFSSKSELSLKPTNHEDTTISASRDLENGFKPSKYQTWHWVAEEEVAKEEAGESPMPEEALEVALLLNYRDCAQPWVKTYLPMDRKDQQIK